MACERKKVCHWCVTTPIKPAYNKRMRYLIYQQEIAPTTNNLHYQVYVEYFRGVRMKNVANTFHGHAEVRKGTRQQARKYCMKKETAVHGTLEEHGEWRPCTNVKTTLKDLLSECKDIRTIVKQYPEWFVRYHRGLKALFEEQKIEQAKTFRNVQVHCIIGDTGTGKTKQATSGSDWFIMPMSDQLWFDGYRGQSTLIIDDFYGGIKYSNLLRITDGHMLQVPVKGGFVYALWTQVIITSNKHPNQWYKMGLTPALQRRINKITTLTLPKEASGRAKSGTKRMEPMRGLQQQLNKCVLKQPWQQHNYMKYTISTYNQCE